MADPNHSMLANCQTGLQTVGTHDRIQRVEFMNGPKLYLLKRDH